MGSSFRQKFSPKFTKQIEILRNNNSFGICGGNTGIIDITSGCPSYYEPQCADRFRMVIPYAGQSLTWEVLFNTAYPEEPPDFIFDAADSGFTPNFEKLPSLVNWDHTDSHSLFNVVQELLEEYKSYQQSLIQSNSRLVWEYSSLVETDFQPEDIEVHITMKPGNRQGQVNFLIKLPIDCSDIPAYLVEDNPGEDSAVLLVKFSSPDGARVTPQLFLSPHVERCFGGSAGLRVPVFPSGGCLVDYVPNIVDLLRNQVDQVVQGYQRRREYISAFLALFGKCVMEYDTEGFTKISLLMEYLDFHFAIHVDLPAFFPIDQPCFTFQSVYREAYSKVVSDYPYSPRWSGNEMAERAKNYILNYIPSFQRSSVKDFSL